MTTTKAWIDVAYKKQEAKKHRKKYPETLKIVNNFLKQKNKIYDGEI